MEGIHSGFDRSIVKQIIRKQWSHRHSENPIERATAIGLIVAHVELLRRFSAV